jgi:hypothetical protein
MLNKQNEKWGEKPLKVSISSKNIFFCLKYKVILKYVK